MSDGDVDNPLTHSPFVFPNMAVGLSVNMVLELDAFTSGLNNICSLTLHPRMGILNLKL